MSEPTTTPVIERIALPQASRNGSTWATRRVLAGFMDVAHFFQVGAEPLSLMQDAERTMAETAHQRAVAVMKGLEPISLGDVVLGEIPSDFSPYLDKVRSSPFFRQVYGQRAVTFGFVDPSRLCAVQPTVKTKYHIAPADGSMQALLEFCLPTTFDSGIEFSVTPQPNGFSLVATGDSNNFDFEGVTTGEEGALIRFSPNKNWVQVVRVNDRFFLKNGYHRVFHLLSQGVTQVPALVGDAVSPQELGCNNPGFFGLDYVLGLRRPPVMRDFLGPVAVELPYRERRRVIQVRAVVDRMSIPE